MRINRAAIVDSNVLHDDTAGAPWGLTAHYPKSVFHAVSLSNVSTGAVTI
jgi:hypothetical protein